MTRGFEMPKRTMHHAPARRRPEEHSTVHEIARFDRASGELELSVLTRPDKRPCLALFFRRNYEVIARTYVPAEYVGVLQSAIAIARAPGHRGPLLVGSWRVPPTHDSPSPSVREVRVGVFV